jgi:hypothetical protein
VPLGSLRDLVTYPLNQAQMHAEGRTDEEVQEVLAWAWVSPDVVEVLFLLLANSTAVDKSNDSTILSISA